MGERTSYTHTDIQAYPGESLVIPASRILRPLNLDTRLMNKLRLMRIKSEMTLAAQLGEIYHLWWHPHNFGNDPEKSLNELDQVIWHFLALKEKFEMESLHMKGLGEKVQEGMLDVG
jgi:hypothetical protein